MARKQKIFRTIGPVWSFLVAWNLDLPILCAYPNPDVSTRIVQTLTNYVLCEEDRSRVRAGYCEFQHQRIRLHRGLLSSSQPEIVKIRNEIFLHEVAHVIADLLFGSKGHDDAWKGVMKSLGLSPTRTHYVRDLLESSLPSCPKKTYECDKCGHLWTRSRTLPKSYRKEAIIVYFHNDCGGKYVLKEETHVPAVRPKSVKPALHQLQSA